MNVTDIATDLRHHIEEGQAWFAKALEQHVPALLAEGERLTKSPIVQALEGIILPPETEAAIAGLITKFASAYGTPAAAAAPPAGTSEPAADAAGAATPPAQIAESQA